MADASLSDLLLRRKMAQQLMQQGMSGEPVQSWTQGLARALQAGLGGYELHQMDEADRAATARLQGAPGLGGPPTVPTAPDAVSPPPDEAVPPRRISTEPRSPMVRALQSTAPPDGPPADPTAPITPRRVPTESFVVPEKGGADPYYTTDNFRTPLDAMAPRGQVRTAMVRALGGTNDAGGDAPPPAQGAPPPANQPPSLDAASPPPARPAAPPAPQAAAQASQPASAPPTRIEMGIPPQMQVYIKTLLADPRTREQGLALYQQYAKPPAGQWEEQTGPGGIKFLRDRITGDMKASPANPEYNIHNRSDGAIVAVNKHNPKDFSVLVPPGASKAIADQKGEEKRAEVTGEGQGKIQVGLGPAIDKAQSALDTIEKVRNHPGRQYGVGALGVLPAIPGTQQAGFVALNNQLKGSVFLDAYEQLKGAGAITEVEGAKAEQARARLDRAQNQQDYETALNDLASAIKKGIERTRKQATSIPSELPGTAGNAQRADPLGLR